MNDNISLRLISQNPDCEWFSKDRTTIQLITSVNYIILETKHNISVLVEGDSV